MEIKTDYLGLELKNPLIVGAGPLTYNSEGVVKCAEAGAGAVVMKSLFEEEIRRQNAALSETLSQQQGMHNEVYEYIRAGLEMRYGPREYLQSLEQARQQVDIPVIASVNCVTDEWWTYFVQEVEAAGADALELNIAILPHTLKDSADEINNRYLRIVEEVMKNVNLPVAVKMSPYFTSVPDMLWSLQQCGVAGFVLFNRFFRSTVDIDNMEVVPGERMSSPGDLCFTLRNLALFSGVLTTDFAAATGVYDGDDIIRAILTGADAVQTVSTLLKNGRDHITIMLQDISNWMEKNGYASLRDFQGKMTQTQNHEAKLFTREQYMNVLGSSLKE